MRLRKALPITALCALTMFACGDDDDAGSNGKPDASLTDSGTSADGGRDSGFTPIDSGSGGPTDAGTRDAGPGADAGTPDGSARDGAAGDAASGDAGGSDGGSATPEATIAPFATGTVTGSAKFSQTGGKVTVVITLANCPDGPHPVHIHEGTSCATAETQGPHWGPGGVRGEGIPDVTCSGQAGTVTYTNDNTSAAKVWTLDGDATTDPTGHAFVVHTGSERIGCGIID